MVTITKLEPIFYGVEVDPVIGEHVSLMNTRLACHDQIVIEDYVSFGHNCMLLTGSHDFSQTNKLRQDKLVTKPITIKQGAFIGSGVIVLGGVTIGKHAVIGAGSVVTKVVPPFEFWAGNPAKFIRKVETHEKNI